MKVAPPFDNKKETIAKKMLDRILNNKVFGNALGSGSAKNIINKKPPVIRDSKTSPWKKGSEKQYTSAS